MTIGTEPRHLLVKRGLYYRPGSQGYTGCKDRAGRYHVSEASPEHGITAIHEDEAPLFAEGCSAEVVRQIAGTRIEALDKAWAAMRWVYENGMQPDHSRPQWVSDAFSDAFGPVRTRTASSGEGV